MKYPKWLPYPKAWGQAIVLCLEVIPVVFIIRLLIPNFSQYKENLDVIDFILASLSLVIFIYGLALMDQFLWADKAKGFPRWFPRWKCWGEALWSFFILALSSVLASFIGFNINTNFDASLSTEESVIGISVIIFVAYFFHIRNLIFRKYKKPNSTDKTNKTSEQKIK